MIARPRLGALAAALLPVAACARPIPPVDPQFVAEWMRDYYGLVRPERVSPPVALRVLAYAAVALCEGLATDSSQLVSPAGPFRPSNKKGTVQGWCIGRTVLE